MTVTSLFYSLAKDFSWRTGFMRHRVFHRYPYCFSPDQLCFLLKTVSSTSMIPGSYVEVGCAWGATTVLLRMHMIEMGIDKVYYAIDTFSGFNESDLKFEVDVRSKPASMANWFAFNKKRWFDTAIEVSKVGPVVSVETCATKFDFDIVKPISFCLLDIDLYLPTLDVLPKLYERLSPGGIIIVDDCAPDTMWDGALQASREFVSSKGLPFDIRLRKLGIVRREPTKPDASKLPTL
jgi:O-methyltransferase